MAKSASDAVLDGSLDIIATCTKLIVCSSQPTTYTEANATYALADIVIDGTDFTKANGDTNGRKVTIGAQSSVLIDTSGTAAHVALVITSAWSAFLTLTGGYEALFTYVTFASVLFGTLGGVAIFVLRRRRPDVPRPYRALGYPLVPALYVLGSFALVWNTLVERPTASVAGLGLVALGLPAYFYWSRSGR